MSNIPNEILSSVLKFKKNIQQDIEVDRIILFGSFVKDNYHKESDIDVCVIAKNMTSGYQTLLKIIPRVLESDIRIEPIVFSKQEYDNPLSFGILKEVKETGYEL